MSAKQQQTIEEGRALLSDEGYKERHRTKGSYFTRLRKLSFPLLVALLIRKSMKSIQLVLNELSLLEGAETVSNSAFSQARLRLKHTAFIELNQKAVVQVRYGDGQYRRYRGFRVLGIDGSKLRLPDTADVRREFGTIDYSDGQSSDKAGAHAWGLASVLYDVLNRVAVDSRLKPGKAYEVEMALGHLAHTQEQDLLLLDRNYPSYVWLASCAQRQRQVVVRCSGSSFAVARQMLRGEGAADQIVTLRPSGERLREVRERGLPEQITLRFVRVTLDTGAYEVLVTSLLDQQTYLTEEFKTIYQLRWGTEGFYDVLKTRLQVENFTGKSAESVYQDFYATVYLTGVESILTNDTDQQLAAKAVKNPQQVNRAVSFNAIKNHALHLLSSNLDPLVLMKQLTALFLTNPTCDRPQRQPPRKKASARTLLDFQRRRRKHCY